MKRLIAIVACLPLFISSVLAVLETGDSLEKMRMELGEPTAQIKRGVTTIFSYPQGVVHIENGRVVKLGEGFYGHTDQISKQTLDGTVEKTITEGMLPQENFSPGRNPANETGLSDEDKAPVITPFVWYRDVNEAGEKAKSLDRPILMVFTKSEGCPPCKELDDLILDDVAFKEYAQANLVLLRLDYAASHPLPEALAEQTQMLKETWGVQEFPMMVMVAPDQTELGRLGYKYLPPEAFVIMLDQLALDGGKSAEKMGNEILRDEFGDAIDGLLFMDSISGSGLLLSAQIFVGCILAFLLIRRLMRR